MVKLIQSGDIPSGTTLMNNWNELYKATALNHIRQLIDRAGVYSKDGEDIWGEAYVDADGRNASVDTGSNVNATFDTNKYKPTSTASSAEIHHTIPSGTFPATISAAVGKALVEDWEDGVSIQYKLTGTSGTEDTGWLNDGEVAEFTAFTAEPDTLIVKLIPKTTSPTAGYPSIRGFALRAS